MKLLGASLLLFLLWVAAISVFLGISWLTVMDKIGHWCLVAYEKALIKIGELRDKAEGKRQQALRQDVFKKEKKRTEGRPPPRIEPTMPTLETSASVRKRSARYPCSNRRRPANCRRCHCWTIRPSTSHPATPRNRSRRCPGSWSSSCGISALRSRSFPCRRVRSLPASSWIRRRA